MKAQLIRITVGMAFAGVTSMASALTQYNVDLVFMEPDTQPRNTIFSGSFSYDAATRTVSQLEGFLTESMTGTASGAAPYYDMTQLQLTHQLASWYDSTLGGSFAAVFLKDTTATFTTMFGGDGWSPSAGVANSGLYAGFPGAYSSSVQNAYALIFVPDDPLAALTQAQIDKLAYADCAPGGMMGATCMTGTSLSGYGSVGTMSGYPLSQTITAAVPEPETYAMFLAGLGLLGAAAKRRRGC
ncbi:PEP-CTERM sorting domain-containing protein [Denitromonas sp.]|uniref:PEP-CTERM sorting domain-containing protein n=1 Tax=Denitromonas sp. TaxID=2734609 RepID=UPI003A87BB36